MFYLLNLKDHENKSNLPTVQLAVKRLFAPIALFLPVLIFFVSCQDNNVSPVEKQETIYKSEITLLEQRLGVTFFKKDITVVDKDRENKVIVRIAALDEEFLNEYLSSRTFSIVPIVEKRTSKSESLEIIDNENQIDENENGGIESKILIEILAKELRPGVVGVGFRDAPSSDYKPMANGRSNILTTTLNMSALTGQNIWPCKLIIRLRFQFKEKASGILDGVQYLGLKPGVAASLKRSALMDPIGLSS